MIAFLLITEINCFTSGTSKKKPYENIRLSYHFDLINIPIGLVQN